MKTTTKFKMLAILAILGFYSSSSFAQENHGTIEGTNKYDQGFKLGFGFNAGGVFDDPYVFAIGGDVRLQYDLSERNSLTLTTGFTNLAINGADNDLGFIPVKAGFKAFFYEKSFYFMGEVGAGFSVTHDYNKTSFLVSPTIGYATKYVDFSLHYEYYPDFPNSNDGTLDKGVSQLGLRIAYGFDL